MYILKVKHPDAVEYTFFGPFKTVDRAHEYAKSVQGWARCIIKTERLIIPYNIGD